MSRFLRTTGGLLLGAVVGAGLVILFAPNSGAETRQQIQEYIDNVLAEGRRAAEVRRMELTTQFEKLKQPRAVTEDQGSDAV